MLVRIFTKNDIGIKMKKLTDHPVRVGRDPKTDGKVMAHFTHVLPGTKSNDDRDQQRGNDHNDTQRPPDHTPADIFKQPENNVQIFHLAVAEGNAVGFITHAALFIFEDKYILLPYTKYR